MTASRVVALTHWTILTAILVVVIGPVARFGDGFVMTDVF
jgi:hypothetical protein